MNAHFQPESIRSTSSKLGTSARVASIDWDALDEGEASRLRHFGFDEGVAVEPLHLGPFGRDPLAVRVGRMTVAIRRSARPRGAASLPRPHEPAARWSRSPATPMPARARCSTR